MRSSYRSRNGDRGNNQGITIPPPNYPNIDLPHKPRDEHLQLPAQKKLLEKHSSLILAIQRSPYYLRQPRDKREVDRYYDNRNSPYKHISLLHWLPHEIASKYFPIELIGKENTIKSEIPKPEIDDLDSQLLNIGEEKQNEESETKNNEEENKSDSELSETLSTDESTDEDLDYQKNYDFSESDIEDDDGPTI